MSVIPTPINVQWAHNLVEVINAVPDCNTLQQAINKVLKVIEDQLKQVLKQIEELALMITPVGNLAQALDFIRKQIAWFQQQYIQALAMQAALMAAYAEIVAAVNAKIAALQCLIPPLVLPVAPSITAQPESVEVAAGDPAVFSVTVTGTSPISYQWYFGTDPISGATSNSYTIASVNTGNVGDYKVKVYNVAGTVMSNTATLSIAVPL